MNTMNDAPVRLIASPKNWMESEAVRQLYAAANLEGARSAVGFPDLHPGRGYPIGAAVVTEDVIHPYFVGGDIGCGIGLWKTDLPRRKAKLDRWTRLRFDLEHPWEGEIGTWLAKAGLASTRFDSSLGTIGGGNHFAEVQAIEKIHDRDECERLDLAPDELLILVHSGSRGLGESILRGHVGQHRAEGVLADSVSGCDYLKAHDDAVRLAKANRALIANRFASALGATCKRTLDVTHNSIARKEDETGSTVWIHRKGAAAADSGPVVVAGSRGALSYLVVPSALTATTAWSIAHGAGRKWTRSASRARVRERFRPDQLAQTDLGGRVICEDRDLLYEEAPMVYKKIEIVIQDLVDAGLVRVVATLRPLLTYKTR
jgi:release factor H-coupled RctB family protein